MEDVGSMLHAGTMVVCNFAATLRFRVPGWGVGEAVANRGMSRHFEEGIPDSQNIVISMRVYGGVL